jgi:hypothetical protein
LYLYISRYPNYKYCPQKKTRKTRAYKKRAENEFSARDFDNKQSLYALYQGKRDSNVDRKDDRHNLLYLIGGSKKKRRSKGPSDNNESSPCQKANLDTTVSLYPPPSYPYYSASPASLQLSESKVNNTSYTPHQSTPLFPVTTYYGSPIASVTYSVPSQHFGCSSSPTSISATTTNSEDVRTEPLVNYNIYSSYYAPLPPSPPTEVVHSTYPYVVGGNVTTLHYVAPNHHYPPPAAHYYNNAANNTIDYNSCLHSYDVKSNPAPPNLLTQPFYYSS